MINNETFIQNQVFSDLMRDALIISDELQDLEHFLELDAKTPTINEYQVFKTLYLKWKIEKCLDKIEQLEKEQHLECSKALAETTKQQFLSLKHIIDTLDMVNKSRQITMSYTQEEAEYIKACEDKKEKENSQIIDYPIRTRLTFTYYKTRKQLSKAEKKKLWRMRIQFIGIEGLIILMFLAAVGKGYAILSIVAIICLILGGIYYSIAKENLLKKHGDHMKTKAYIIRRTGDKVTLGIKDLNTACLEYMNLIKVHKRYLYKDNCDIDMSKLGKYISKAKRGFNKYEDYITYVQFYLIGETLNPLLVEKGIVYRRERDLNEEIRKYKRKGLMGKQRKLPKLYRVGTYAQDEDKIYKTLHTPVQKSNKPYHPVKGQHYSSTKVTSTHFSKGRKGR